MPAKSAVGAMIKAKCPRCRTGKMFVHSLLPNPFRFQKMHIHCPHCEVRLEPEPGFYQGAMYVSYGFTVGIMLVVGLLVYYLLNDPSDWTYIGIVIGVMLLLVPVNYRFSRVVYLYSFGGLKYDPRLSA